MARKWTKEKAESVASKYIGERKIIFLDGTATLTICSAIDYLINHQGYIYGIQKQVETPEN